MPKESPWEMGRQKTKQLLFRVIRTVQGAWGVTKEMLLAYTGWVWEAAKLD